MKYSMRLVSLASQCQSRDINAQFDMTFSSAARFLCDAKTFVGLMSTAFDSLSMPRR